MNLFTQSLQLFHHKTPAVPAAVESSTLPTEQDLVRAGALLARERNFKDLVNVFVEQAQDISRVDLSAFYILKDAEDDDSDLKLVFKRGSYPVPEIISGTCELVRFLRECREALIFNNKQNFEESAPISEGLRAETDKKMREYIALVKYTDTEYYLALVAPVARQLYVLYDSIISKSQPVNDYSGDALMEFYNKVLEEAVNGIEVILTDAGMIVETLDWVFDTQKHKLLKTIPTDNEKLDRTIANTYTDCYIYDGKVVYQSKVDVYKFQQLTKGEEKHG
jgi:hypothetical protein